ncbi:MAG: YciI family protein, partial [Candidatus Rokuibacteriota bacterium]
MEFVLLFTDRKGAPGPELGSMAEMAKLSGELASRKILRRGAPLASESAAACVRVHDGKPFVTDGPFTESKEVIGGFWVVDVAGFEEAIEIARRSPHASDATVEVHRLPFRIEFGDAAKGTPFLLLFRMEPGWSDPDGAGGREMRAFGEGLVRTATLFETGRLAEREPSARIGAGRPVMTDGPFTESKEVIGGYALVRVGGRADAIEL